MLLVHHMSSSFLLLTLFWSFISVCLANQQLQVNGIFSDFVLPRITERLNQFFDLPFEIVQHYLKQFERGSGNLMIERNRQAVSQNLYAQSLTARNIGFEVEINLAFDDGVVVSIANSGDTVALIYREPGADGYNVPNIQTKDPNYKHYISCFNNVNGTKQNCTMQAGQPYIECVNDCELIPCPATVNGNGTSVLNETFLCRNYNIKQVQEGEQFGYIPMVELCLNRRGEPEGRPGYVLSNRTTDEVGKCYYNDQTTPVNQVQPSGDYFACGGNGAVCDNTFAGARTNIMFDPRYGPLFAAMRNDKLKPIWIGPSRYAWSYFLYIGYQHPIFTMASRNMNGTSITKDVKVFQGGVSANYRLAFITQFLRNEYNNTDFQVLVVEEVAPHYVIATSYHQKLYHLKAILLAEETKPCPDVLLQEYVNNATDIAYQFDTELCDVVRIPILDWKHSTNEFDVVSYRAFTAHQKNNFQENSVVYLKNNDDIGSQAYASQETLYRLPKTDGTTVWHVIAIFPINRSQNDASVRGDTSFAAICSIACFGFVGCFSLLIKYIFSTRRSKRFQQKDSSLTIAFLFSCTSLNVSTFALLGENTDPMCMLRMWSFNSLLVCVLSTLLVKVWRIKNHVIESERVSTLPISKYKLFLYTLPLIVLELLILAVFSIADPPLQTERLGVGAGLGVQEITCQHTTNAFFITQIVFDVVIIGFGCILSYRALRLYSKFTEAIQVGFCWYNIALSSIVTSAAIILIDKNHESQKITQAIGVFWATFFCCFCYVLPMLLPVTTIGLSSTSTNNNERGSSGSILNSSTSFTNRQPITRPILSSDVSDMLSRFDNQTKSGILETIVENNDPMDDNMSFVFTSSQQEDKCKENHQELDQ